MFYFHYLAGRIKKKYRPRTFTHLSMTLLLLVSVKYSSKSFFHVWALVKFPVVYKKST